MLRESGGFITATSTTAAPRRFAQFPLQASTSFSSACAAERPRTKQEFGNVFLNEVIKKPELLPPFITTNLEASSPQKQRMLSAATNFRFCTRQNG
jgi:hypothetical protein